MGVSEEASVVEASVGEGETHQDGLPRLFPSPAAVPLVFLASSTLSSKMDCSGTAGAMTVTIPTHQTLRNVLMNRGPWGGQ